MSHDERHDHDQVDTGTGVGTDGSLHSPKEEPDEHGADRSGDLGDGVGTDGSLVDPEKATRVDPESGRLG
jgi:hypothetical protein